MVAAPVTFTVHPKIQIAPWKSICLQAKSSISLLSSENGSVFPTSEEAVCQTVQAERDEGLLKHRAVIAKQVCPASAGKLHREKGLAGIHKRMAHEVVCADGWWHRAIEVCRAAAHAQVLHVSMRKGMSSCSADGVHCSGVEVNMNATQVLSQRTRDRVCGCTYLELGPNALRFGTNLLFSKQFCSHSRPKRRLTVSEWFLHRQEPL